MDESPEEFASPDRDRRCDGVCSLRDRNGRVEVERAVGPVLVVVADIDAKNVFELAAAEDQEPIEALLPRGADPALDVRVRVRRLQRRPDDPYSLAAEDVVAGAAELGVTVVDEKLRSLAASSRSISML
jgi:hypothetical protein